VSFTQILEVNKPLSTVGKFY